MLDRQTVVDRVVDNVVVFRSADLFIHHGLDIRILGGVDLKTAGEEEIVGLRLRVAFLVLQGF